MAARKPAEVIIITPGTVNHWSLLIIFFMVKDIMAVSLVVSACFIQKSPVYRFPIKTITAII
jgi:hypothetical protein